MGRQKLQRYLPLPSTPEELLKLLGELGLTNEEIAPIFGLSDGQFAATLDQLPHLRDILEQAKEAPNRRVEASLYKRALGYQTREIIKVEGKAVKVIVKEVAPDVIADIFWLKNRDPKRWRDVVEVRHTLRDRLGRAHEALRLGHTPTMEQEEGGEEEGLKS